MTTLSPNEALLDDVQQPSWFGGAGQFTWVTESTRDCESREHWQAIQDMLLRWLHDPRRAIDDDYEAPTRSAIRAALRCVQVWQRSLVRNPTRVAPTGDGGIVCEWAIEPVFIEVEIEGDGAVEFRSYREHRLVQRTYLV